MYEVALAREWMFQPSWVKVSGSHYASCVFETKTYSSSRTKHVSSELQPIYIYNYLFDKIAFCP